jgi:hypothetical protein
VPAVRLSQPTTDNERARATDSMRSKNGAKVPRVLRTGSFRRGEMDCARGAHGMRLRRRTVLREQNRRLRACP